MIDLLRALQAGKELSNAETWKKTQLWTNSLVVLLTSAISVAASQGYAIPLTGEQISTLVAALAVVVGLFNSYTTVATTSRIGLQPKGGGNSPGVSDGTGYGEVSNRDGQWFRDLDDRDVPELHDVDIEVR